MNARVLTPTALGGIGPQLTRAQAVLVRNGKIEALGSDEDVRRAATVGTEFVDLRGRTVVPGFIDAHIHPIFYGLSLQGVPCLPPRVTSIADLKREVKERVSRAGAGEWIWGQGYDDTRLMEGRHPTRDDLDEPSSGHPVVLTRVCGHMCVANSRALELAGVDASTPDPPGGRIAHDASGRPTGLLLETAEDLVLGRVSNTRENVMTALRRVSDDLLRRGITACCDAWLGYSEGAAEYDIWTEALETGVFRPSISFLVQHKLWQAASDEQDAATGLNVLGVKIVADGSISGGSAGLDDPFLGDGDDRLFVYEAEELRDICAAVRSKGLVIAIHAMGDGAISMALDAVERSRTIATERNPKMRGARERSHRIEHCSLPRRSDIQRMAQRGVIPVIQPIFLFAEGEAYLAKLGKERSMWANPARAMIDAGVHVAMSSDAPATTWGEPTDVMLGIQTSVTRRTWAGSSLGTGQATTAAEALVGYTWNAAHAAGFGKTLGSIAVGRRADMVVLSEDPTRVPTEAIGDVRIIATLLAGELVHGEL